MSNESKPLDVGEQCEHRTVIHTLVERTYSYWRKKDGSYSRDPLCDTMDDDEYSFECEDCGKEFTNEELEAMGVGTEGDYGDAPGFFGGEVEK